MKEPEKVQRFDGDSFCVIYCRPNSDIVQMSSNIATEELAERMADYIREIGGFVFRVVQACVLIAALHLVKTSCRAASDQIRVGYYRRRDGGLAYVGALAPFASQYSVVGWVLPSDGDWMAYEWTSRGETVAGEQRKWDLVEYLGETPDSEKDAHESL